VTDGFSSVRSYSTHIQAGMTNDDDDLSSFSELPLGSGLAIVLFRVHFKLFDLYAVVMVGQREINANFSGNRLYACPNRVRDRPVFRRSHFSAFLYVDTGASI